MSLFEAIKDYFLSHDQAFENMLAQHFDELTTLCARLCDSTEDADDLMQSFLLQIMQKKPQLTHTDNAKGFLLKSLHNLYIDQWRRKKNNPLRFAQNHEVLEIQPAQDLLLEDQADLDQLIEKTSVALAHILPESRMILVMHDMLGYGLNEIAKDLNIPLGTVKSRLHRARNTVRKTLGFTYFE